MAQLGWIAGPLAILLFASLTFVSAFSLCNCCKSSDPESGPARNPSCLDAVRMILGKRSAAVCSIFLRINLVKIGIVCTITSAISMTYHYICYQHDLFSQALFADLEGWIAGKFPDSGFINNNYALKVPLVPGFRLNLLRLCFRTAHVALITGVAGLNFWPVVVFFPTEMYIAQKNIGARTRKWVTLRIYTLVCLLVILFAFVGSLEGLITARFS